ncbi:MAG: sialidase family protein [Acidobacteriota bacterium]
MRKLILVAMLIVAIALGVQAQSIATHADRPSEARPAGRLFQLPLTGRPNIANKKEILRMPLNPFAGPVPSPAFRRKREAKELGEDDEWLYRPRVFQRFSQATRSYLSRKHSIRGRALRRALIQGDVLSAARLAASNDENIRVNDPRLDNEDRTQSETSAAAFGNTILVSFNNSAGFKEKNISGLSISRDNGTTWRQTQIPTYPGGFNLGDGVLAVDTRGNFYYSMVALDMRQRVTIAVSRSTDKGMTWSQPVDASTTLVRDGAFQDKEWITADRSPSSPFKNRIYLTWTNFQPNGKANIVFARSRNRGRSFAAPKKIAESTRPNGFVQGSMVATGPAGEIYISWIDSEIGKTDIKLTRSTDGGKTFMSPVILASFRNPTYPANGIFDANSFPSLAVDISSGRTRGNVYVTFAARGETAPDRADILLVHSTDGGMSWSTPRKLNDDQSIADQLLPSAAVAEDGAVAISWYDRRNDLANLSLIDVYATVSTDGGNSFSPNRRITTTNWPLIPTPFNLRAGYHGDYHQLAVRGQQFIFNWADDRSGKDADVYITLKTGEELAGRTPDFVLSARTSSQVIKPGDTTFFTIDVRALEGATGMLSFTATPNIAGLSFSFDSIAAPLGETVSLNIQSTRDLAPGPYLISISAKTQIDGRELVRTTNTRLTVLDPAALVKSPQNITNNPSGSMFPRAAIDAAGNINVTWLDDSPGIFSIFFTRSTDGGRTFSDPLMLPRNDSFIGTPLIAADDRNIYIAYLELFETPDFIFETSIVRSTDAGRTFSSPQVISRDRKIFVIPESLQLDRDGSIHFGAMTLSPPDNSKPVFTNFDVKSTDNGATFTFSKIFASSSPLSQPIVAVEGDGQTVRSLFVDFNRERGGLLLTRSTDGGLTYAPPIALPTQVDKLIFASIFFAANNRSHVTYVEGSFQTEEFELFYTRSGENGRFSTPVTLTGNAATILSASLAVDAQNNVVVAYEGSFDKFSADPYVSRIFYCNSTDGGASFTMSKSFEPARGGDFFPTVLLDLAGEFSIIWDGFSRDAIDIFYSISTNHGRSFAAPVNLSNNAGFSSYADLSFDERGRIQLLWQDNTPGSFEIFRIKLGKE